MGVIVIFRNIFQKIISKEVAHNRLLFADLGCIMFKDYTLQMGLFRPYCIKGTFSY